jgi:DNA-binding SARP family transcriptional activator
VHPEGRTREQIGLVFWPEASAAQLKNSFHVTLHHLRKVLGRADLVVFEDDRYRVNESLGVDFDSVRFRRDLAAAMRSESVQDLRDALALYRGDFLEQLSAGDWHLEHRDEMRRLYLDGIMVLGDRLMDDEQYADAAEVYRQLVAREPLYEEAYRRLMICHGRLGERAEAIRYYERLRSLLRGELETDPERETTRLVERLRRSEAI